MMLVAGKLGLNISATSFCNSFKITATSDDNIFNENEELTRLIEHNIRQEIERNAISIESVELKKEK